DNDTNRILKAVISDSDVDAGNDVVVDVNSRSSHRAIAVGGALAADVAVAGSSSSNRITQYIDAAVEGETSVVAGRDVVIHSVTTEVIETDVIQGAGSAGFSIAGAIASNHVDTVGRARVGKGVDVNAVGNVSIEAVDQTAVDSNAGEVGVGVYVAGAGASISTVQVHKDVQAFIDAQANVQATAAHPGTIQAYTGEHDANGNFLREEMRGIEVQATSNETIKNRTFGVNAGLYAGVAAAVTATVVQPHVEAWIGKEATVDADSGGAPGANGEKVPTNVNVSAVNHSTIEDSATGVGLGIAGVSGAVDVGRVRHFVWGHVDNDADVKALNDIDVHGLSKKMIDSNTVSGGAGAVGLSGSVSVWNIGAPFNAEYMLNGTKMKALESGGTAVDEFASAAADLVNVRLDKRFGPGTPSKKDLYSDLHAKDRLSGVIATIKKNAILTAGDDIDVRAREWMQIDISTGGAGVGIYAGVGAAVAVTNVHSDTDAGVFGHLNAGNDTRVQATLEETTVSKSLSGEIGIGAAGAAVGVVNESSEQSARVAYGGWIESTDRLLVEADEYLDVDVTTGQGTLGLVAIAAAVSEIHEEGLTEAYLSDATIGDMFDGGAHDVCDPSLSQVRLAVVRSDVDHDLTTNAFAIEAGGLSVSVTRSEVDDQHRSDSWVGDGSTVMLRESLLVGNRTFLNGDAGLTAVTAGAVAVAVPVSRVEMQPDVSTYVEDAHVCVGDDVFIQTNNDSLANAQGYAAGISAAGLEAIRVDALAHPDVDTWIKGRETRIQAGNDVSVESSVTQNALVNATRGAVSGFALGSMNATADNSGSTSTRIGESAKLLVGNNLDIRSDASGESAVDVISPTVSGAIIQDNNVSAVASFDTEARLGATGVVVVGGNTTIESLSDRSAATDVASIGVSGLTGATSNAQSIADGRNDAVLAGRLNSTSDLTVVASENNRTVTNADSFSVSGVTLSGLDSKTSAKPVVRAVVSAPVDATGDIAIMANADMETSASGRTIGVSAVTAGQANITAESTPTVVAELTGAAEVNTDGDISLLAEHSLGPVVAGEPVVTGFAAEVGLIGGYTGMNLTADSVPTVAAHVGDGAEIIEADDLEVKAQSETQMSVVDEAFSLMGAIGIGGTNSAIHSGGNISSNLGGIIGKVDDVDVSARNESVVNAGSTATSLAVVGAVPSGRAETSVDPHVQSTLTTDVYASGNVNMRTESVSDADSEVRYDSGALLAAVGNTEAHSSVSPVIETVVSSEVTVHADGSINLESLHNVDQSGSFLPNGASSSSEAAAYAGGAAASNSIATATSNPSISTRADERAELFTEQGDIALRSQSFSDATAVADATQVGAGGVGSVESVAVSSGSVESVLNGVESATARNGDIEVFALTRNDSAVSGVGTQGGILAGLGNAVETNATSAPNVSARAGATNVIDAGNDVRLIAMGAGDVDADAAETSRSLLFNLGAVNARGSYEPVVESLVLPDTTITAGNDVNLLGYGNVLDASGAYDTARAVNVDSVSRGAALVTGRSAASESNVDSLVTAFIGDNANVNAGNDAVVKAGSYTQVDTDSFTRLIGLIGFQCLASATNSIEVSTLSGSPDLTSPSGFSLTAGDDIEVVSDTDLRSRADSDAVVTGLGWAQANSENDISDVDTVALLGNGTATNAGDTVLVHADKFVGTSVTANTGLLGSANTSDSITANTAAIVTGTATSIGGTSITVSVVDPIVSKVKSTVTDRNSSAEDFAQAVKEGRIGAQAGVAADVVLLSGIDDGVAVNADKVRVINTLAKLDLSADAELNTRHQHEIE
ncbi:MAG: beta strand repeat-containing protein, partial [Rubripirellula sp.]